MPAAIVTPSSTTLRLLQLIRDLSYPGSIASWAMVCAMSTVTTFWAEALAEKAAIAAVRTTKNQLNRISNDPPHLEDSYFS